MEKIITGNIFNKFNSVNPIYKRLMTNFISHLLKFIDNTKPLKILEPGCGEGFLARILIESLNPIYYAGFEIEDKIVSQARTKCPKGSFFVNSLYNLSDYKTSHFDYVIVSEVLEHLEKPHVALLELKALNADKFIFTVPNEPIWTILNIVRLKYLNDMGNTPGHIQHWNKNNFEKLLRNYFQIIEIKSVFPWTMALCIK